MHLEVYYKSVRNGENIFCDKIYNILGKWGCKEYKKRKFGKQLGKSRRRFTKCKRFRKEWRQPFKKYLSQISSNLCIVHISLFLFYLLDINFLFLFALSF